MICPVIEVLVREDFDALDRAGTRTEIDEV
jgi:hypothetical protein